MFFSTSVLSESCSVLVYSVNTCFSVKEHNLKTNLTSKFKFISKQIY